MLFYMCRASACASDLEKSTEIELLLKLLSRLTIC